MLANIFIILGLIVLNGIFAMTELAVVSSRRAWLMAKAESGSRSAKVALSLKDNPSKFLSTVQIGITLIGVVAGAYSGATVAKPLGEYLSQFSFIGRHANEFAIVFVVGTVTYLSLVIGELVPKQIALRYANGVAVFIAFPILWLSVITKPLVWLLDVSNKFVLALLRIRPDADNVVSQEEVRAVIAESAESGALEPEEKQMLERVMKLDDISVKAVITHRKDIVFLTLDDSDEEILKKVEDGGHSQYVVCDNGSMENIFGTVEVKDLIVQYGKTGEMDLKKSLRPPVHVSDNETLFNTLEHFKKSSSDLAVVLDEYGEVEGIITVNDIVQAIVGRLPDYEDSSHNATRREDGSWLVDASISIYEAEEILGVKGLGEDAEGATTLAGFCLHQLGRIPKAGDYFQWQNARFEVVDMDGMRIDKILARVV